MGIVLPEVGESGEFLDAFLHFNMQPLVKTVGGVPVNDLDVPVTSQQLPPARLDIALEREHLRTVVDVEDKARWRAMIREKHRLERKKAKEARKAEKAEVAPRLPSDVDYVSRAPFN